MQRAFTLLCISILFGCQTTRFVDVTPLERDAVLLEINTRAAEQEATVTTTDKPLSFSDIRGLHLTAESWSYVNPYTDEQTLEPLDMLRQVDFAATRKPGLGALLGGVTGGLILGALSASDNQECKPDQFCIFDMSDSQAFTAGFIIGGLGGAAVGALVGGLIGQPRTIYRFHPGSHNQISVVIGPSRPQ